MAWADWMVVSPTLEEELKLEWDARSIMEDEDHKDIAKLCAQLSKQNWYQQKLMEQAVAHIMELEAKIAASEMVDEILKEKKQPWIKWKTLFRSLVFSGRI